jgi:hypothetical protein
MAIKLIESGSEECFLGIVKQEDNKTWWIRPTCDWNDVKLGLINPIKENITITNASIKSRNELIRKLFKEGQNAWDQIIWKKNILSRQPIKEATMNSKDLRVFAEQIKQVVKKIEPFTNKKLNLTFQDNEIDFGVGIYLTVTSVSPPRERFGLSFSFSAKFAKLNIIDDDNRHMYQDDDFRKGLMASFTKEHLLKFADDLEKEAS